MIYGFNLIELALIGVIEIVSLLLIGYIFYKIERNSITKKK